jgi:hypothetical protein
MPNTLALQVVALLYTPIVSCLCSPNISPPLPAIVYPPLAIAFIVHPLSLYMYEFSLSYFH